MANRKPASFKDLQKIWYEKLEKSGFEDIETDEDHLKVWSNRFASQKSVASYQAKQSYYSMAEHFLNDYPFTVPRERTIWEYHANGISVRDIADTLNKLSRSDKTKTNRTTVWQIVKKLEGLMYKMYNIQGTEND